MKVAFLVEQFPTISETFILRQITGLIDIGVNLRVFSLTKPQNLVVHPEVYNYNLIKRTYYIGNYFNVVNRMLSKGKFLTNKIFGIPLPVLECSELSRKVVRPIDKALLYSDAKFHKLKGFDILHCHFGPNGKLGAELKRSGLFKGRLITTFHGYDVHSYPYIYGIDIYKDLFRIGDFFTTNTQYTKEKALKLGAPEEKTAILPVGLDPRKIKFRERKFRANTEVRILTVARLVEKKGYEYTLQAIAKILNKKKDIRYIIAGDGALKGKLRSLIMDLGIQDHVMMTGKLTEEEILKLYQSCHIFVLSSCTADNTDSEGQGLVIQEAQAAGLPIISTYHDGIPEGVVNGKSAFLVPEKDVDALAERLTYLIENPGIWPEMGRCGRKFVEENYDIRKLNKKLVQIYEMVLQDNKSHE